MNQKVMMFLSFLLIIIAIIGLGLTIQKKKSLNQNSIITIKKDKKRDIEVLVLKKDIKVGQSVDISDFVDKTVTIEDDDFEKKDIILYNTDISSFKGAIAMQDIKANESLKKSMFAKRGSAEYSRFRLSPEKGYLSYKFSLGETEKTLLEDVSPNDMVDIYFKYAMKNPDRPDGIAPKKDKYNQEDLSSTNIVKLVPIFSKKRVLYFTPKYAQSKDIGNGKFEDKSVELENEGNVYVELNQDEIKQIYSLSGLGDFVLLPSDKESYLKEQSTKFLLSKEFIKEIRGSGGDDGSQAR